MTGSTAATVAEERISLASGDMCARVLQHARRVSCPGRAVTLLDTIVCLPYDFRAVAARRLAELRSWPIQALTVDDEVDALVKERDHARNLLALGQRRAIRPSDVL